MFAMLFGVHQLFFIWACFTFEIMKLPVLQYTNMHEITFNVYEVRTHVFQHRLEFFPKCTLPTVIIYEHTQRVVALEIPCIRLNWCEHWQIARVIAIRRYCLRDIKRKGCAGGQWSILKRHLKKKDRGALMFCHFIYCIKIHIYVVI